MWKLSARKKNKKRSRNERYYGAEAINIFFVRFEDRTVSVAFSFFFFENMEKVGAFITIFYCVINRQGNERLDGFVGLIVLYFY